MQYKKVIWVLLIVIAVLLIGGIVYCNAPNREIIEDQTKEKEIIEATPQPSPIESTIESSAVPTETPMEEEPFNENDLPYDDVVFGGQESNEGKEPSVTPGSETTNDSHNVSPVPSSTPEPVNQTDPTEDPQSNDGDDNNTGTGTPWNESITLPYDGDDD